MTLKKKGEKNPGFTLIELSVVVILIGVVFLIVMPRLTGLFSGRKLLGFSRELAGALDYTRSRAVVDGRVYNFHIDRDKREYWFAAKEDDDKRRSYYRAREDEEKKPPRKRKIPEGITIARLKLETRIVDRYKPVIRFYPRGNSNGAEIYLETRQGDKVLIKVKSYTGKSAIEVVD